MPSNTKEFHETLRNMQENMRKSSYNRALQRSGVSSLMPSQESETLEIIPTNIEEVPQQPINWLDKIKTLLDEVNKKERVRRNGWLTNLSIGQKVEERENGGEIY